MDDTELVLVASVPEAEVVDVVEVVADEAFVSMFEPLADGGGPGGGPSAPIMPLASWKPPLALEPDEFICAITAAMEAPICAEPPEKSIPEVVLDGDDESDVDEPTKLFEEPLAAACCCINC